MMSRRQKVAVAMLSAFALAVASDVARAQSTSGAESAAAPPYTLEVDSDAPDAISFESLAGRIGSDLGAPVTRSGAVAASRAAISIRYRGGELTVRAVHPGGGVLERTVKPQGDDVAVQREAVLLAGNLARDEAREILAGLEPRLPTRPTTEPAPSPSAPAAAPTPPTADEGEAIVTAAFFYPWATNVFRPNITSWVDLSLLYGRVGRVRALQLGGVVTYASRDVTGVQLAGTGAVTRGSLSGVQFGGAASFAGGRVEGTQLAGAASIAAEGVSGLQLAGAVNVALGSVKGAALSGAVNVATHDVTGAQISPVNVGDSVEGVQVGLVNVASRVRGVQLGIINVADEVDGAAIGLVSITRDGVHPIVWGSNLHYMNAGVKFATKYFYTITALQMGTLETGVEPQQIGTTVAFGGHIPIGTRFDVELETAIVHAPTDSSPFERSRRDPNMWSASHVLPGYSFARHFRIFAGGGVRAPITVEVGRAVLRPEVMAGVQF